MSSDFRRIPVELSRIPFVSTMKKTKIFEFIKKLVYKIRINLYNPI
jgi:hypothetical protein